MRGSLKSKPIVGIVCIGINIIIQQARLLRFIERLKQY